MAVSQPPSAFADVGLSQSIEETLAEIRTLYLADTIPWILGYSGGKDSGAALQLVWLALRGIPPALRTKPVHVISTDTLVENPIVAKWAEGSLDAMKRAATGEGLPIEVHRLRPALRDTFWVLLIGKGYPAPRRLTRWCTDRLKIRPSNDFVRRVISERGEAILILGTRKAESTGRKARMERLEAERVRDKLSPNASLPGSLVYSPIESWSNDDVWLFLMQYANPWGWSNKALLTLYQGASDGGECPLVVESGTPSCGSSRFGCWVCTLVEQDKSMAAMVQNDADKEWLLPLLDLRNALDFRLHEDGDRPLRDFRRMNGKVQLMITSTGERPIPGPYKQHVRADWLRRLLAAERYIRENGPEDVRTIRLITHEELTEIRRIWVLEKHEVEDLLPGIVAEVTGEPFDGEDLLVNLGIDHDDLAMLRGVAGDDHLYAMLRDLLVVEHEGQQQTRRAGLFGRLEEVLRRYQFKSEEEAVAALGGNAPGQFGLFAPPPANPPTAKEHRERAASLLGTVGARAAGSALGELADGVGVALATGAKSPMKMG